MIPRSLPLAALALLAVPAHAAPFQNTPSLDAAVAGFTGHAIGEDGGARTAVDARLKLAQCPTVALSWRTPQHDAVVVACSGPAWRIFVPVQLAAPAAVASSVAAAAAASAAPVIKRGDPVLIEANADGFSISRDGVAMGDAAPGGRLLVKVDDGKPPVQAVAQADGRATLPGWEK